MAPSLCSGLGSATVWEDEQVTDPSTGSGLSLADRYGGSRRGHLVTMIMAGVLVVAFLAWLAWTTWSYSTPEVRSEMVSWDVKTQHEAVALVDVRLSDPTVVATCTLRAFAEDHTVVGERSFTVPMSDDGADGRLEISVRTDREATSVELLGCTTPDQRRPR